MRRGCFCALSSRSAPAVGRFGCALHRSLAPCFEDERRRSRLCRASRHTAGRSRYRAGDRRKRSIPTRSSWPEKRCARRSAAASPHELRAIYESLADDGRLFARFGRRRAARFAQCSTRSLRGRKSGGLAVAETQFARARFMTDKIAALNIMALQPGAARETALASLLRDLPERAARHRQMVCPASRDPGIRHARARQNAHARIPAFRSEIPIAPVL